MATPGATLPYILADTHTGTNLSTFLNNWASYVRSTRRSTSRPADLTEGGMWYNESTRELTLVAPSSGGLVDTPVAKFDATTGAKIFEGVEVFLNNNATPPSSPAEKDIWFVPSYTRDGKATNQEIRVYIGSPTNAWVKVVTDDFAKIILSTTITVEPSPVVTKWYGYMWHDTVKNQTNGANNGLQIWNGTEYVPAWPVVDGETMAKITKSGAAPTGDPDVGLIHIEYKTSPAESIVWIGDGDEWVEISDIVPFATQVEVDAGVVTDKAVSPLTFKQGVFNWIDANDIYAYSASRDGDIVRTQTSGGAQGKIDPTLTLTTGFGYEGLWTATVGTEYPLNPSAGEYWMIENDPSYTFTTGDLNGQTAYLNDAILYDGTTWKIFPLFSNLSSALQADGSVQMTGNLEIIGSVGTQDEPRIYLVDEDWHTFGDPGEPALLNGFTEAAYGTYSRFRKMPTGMVEVQIKVRYVDTNTENLSVANLPLGYYPNSTLILPGTMEPAPDVSSTPWVESGTIRFLIDTTGVIKIMDKRDPDRTGSNGMITLHAVYFAAPNVGP